MARPRVTETASVLDAAAQHLTAHGVAGTTLDDIAAAAGVSRITVYRYGGSKIEIIQTVILQATDRLLDEVTAAVRQCADLAEALSAATSTALEVVHSTPLLQRLITTDLDDTMRFLTTDSPALVQLAVRRLAEATREIPGIAPDAELEVVAEEAVRHVLSHLTTPRLDGTRLTPHEAGRRAAALAHLAETT